MKKYIFNIIRVVVGLVFTFSGFVKLVDPKGTSYKLHEYFSSEVLNLPFFQDYTLPLSVVFVVAETLLGVFLLLGIFKRFTLYSLLGLIAFFSLLTFYSAYYSKVTDCGCFGDALKLDPWQSFYKDVFLLVAVLLLLAGHRYLKPLFSKRVGFTLSFIALLATVWVAYYGIDRLPIIDFRPYAIGDNLKENMKDKRAPVVEIKYTLKNKQTKEIKVINSTNYLKDKWWEKQQWIIQPELTTDKVIDKGRPAKIHDFVIKDKILTRQVLNENKVVLIVNYDPNTNKKKEILTTFIKKLKKENIKYYILSSFKMSGFENVYTLDPTALKTIIRSSPGVVLIEKGVVKGKWSWHDLPDAKKIKSID